MGTEFRSVGAFTNQLGAFRFVEGLGRSEAWFGLAIFVELESSVIGIGVELIFAESELYFLCFCFFRCCRGCLFRLFRCLTLLPLVIYQESSNAANENQYNCYYPHCYTDSLAGTGRFRSGCWSARRTRIGRCILGLDGDDVLAHRIVEKALRNRKILALPINGQVPKNV